jgi:hypothetical protein
MKVHDFVYAGHKVYMNLHLSCSCAKILNLLIRMSRNLGRQLCFYFVRRISMQWQEFHTLAPAGNEVDHI